MTATHLVISLEDVSAVCLVGALGFTAVHALYTTGCGDERETEVADLSDSVEVVGGGVGWSGEVIWEEVEGVADLIFESCLVDSDCWQLWDLVWETVGTDFDVSQVSRRCTCGVGTIKSSWFELAGSSWSWEEAIAVVPWGVFPSGSS